MIENMIRNYVRQKNNQEYQKLKASVLKIMDEEDRRRGIK